MLTTSIDTRIRFAAALTIACLLAYSSASLSEESDAQGLQGAPGDDCDIRQLVGQLDQLLLEIYLLQPEDCNSSQAYRTTGALSPEERERRLADIERQLTALEIAGSGPACQALLCGRIHEARVYIERVQRGPDPCENKPGQLEDAPPEPHDGDDADHLVAL